MASEDIAQKIKEHDEQISILFDYVSQLLGDETKPKNPIGYFKYPDED